METSLGKISPDIEVDGLKCKTLGSMCEAIAADFLEGHGYEVYERNWRCDFGEIDLVCKDASTAILVEVKSRRCSEKDADVIPELAVDGIKQRKYAKLALRYLAVKPQFDTVRFDVIAVNVTKSGQFALRHLQDAYDWSY